MTYAQVALPVPSRAGSLFTYAVPPGMPVGVGRVVMAPLGNRKLPGVVYCLDDAPPAMLTRELLGPVQDAPSVDASRLRIASWISAHYLAPLFDCISLFLPPGWSKAVEIDGTRHMDPGCWRFRWPAPPLSDSALVEMVPGSSVAAGWTGVKGRVASWLGAAGPSALAAVAAGAGCAPSTVRKMVANGLLRPVEEPGLLVSPPACSEARAGDGLSPAPPITLNSDQERAFAPVAATLAAGRHQVFLVHGVTGSGKTHVYLKLIESLVARGRRAIVLVSEIAQTPEALSRYTRQFPGRVALLHSDMPLKQRWLLWRDISLGRYDVVIGPRSALFSPVPDLGMVVLDEEHEPAYKQEEHSPRYHARDVAVEIGKSAGVPVVLGSATPDVGSYYLAERGAYRLLTLPGRYAGPTSRGHSAGRLPGVKIVDLRQELRAGNFSVLSRDLRGAMAETLDAGHQAILFLNRRGSSTAVVCRDCGEAIKCRRCDLPLVYHRALGELLCHQCNRRKPLPEKCPTCKRTRINYFGAGTEKVEDEVKTAFPNARVLRWDHDVTGPRGSHARIHQQFLDHGADILVGTQMVAKALDFPLVTLVGVVLADVSLQLPDFKAAERTFQLLSQVAGRAGRGDAEGRVVIQTYRPDHYSVLAAAGHDYQAFYRQELAFRRRHGYPPFRRFARLLFTGSGEVRARVEAIEMRRRLQATADEKGIRDLSIIGPAPAFHSRVRGRHRWQIVLAGEGLAEVLAATPLPMGWAVDVDPVSSL